MDKKKIAMIVLYDLIASFLLGVSIVIFAVQANFAPGGVSGLAVIFNYLFDWPIGLVTVIINVPIVLATFKKLGPAFFICSVKSVLVNAFFIDYVVCLLPAYTGSRMIAASLSGVFAGVAYSMLLTSAPPPAARISSSRPSSGQTRNSPLECWLLSSTVR